MERLTEWVDDGDERFAIPRMDLRQNGHKKCVIRLARYEDTGLEPGRVQEFVDVDSRTKEILGNAITVSEIIQQFLDFYEAQCDESRIEDAVLLTNEEAGKWRKLKERDTAKKKVINGGMPVCPVCGAKVFAHYWFCRDCGQRLKWEDENGVGGLA